MLQPQASLSDEILLAQQQVDRNVAAITKKLKNSTFDPAVDGQLLAKLVENFSDSRGLTRMAIAEALAEVGQPASPYLIPAIGKHPNAVVRRAAAKTMTLIADRAAIPTLIHALLNDEDTVVHGSAAGALARMGEEAVPELLNILADPHTPQNTIGHVAWALAFIGAEASEPIYEAVDSDSPEVRAAVIGAISNIAEHHPEHRAFILLLNALQDPSQNVRSEAASGLAKIKYVDAIPYLLDLLQSSEAEDRKAAALSLMKLEAKEAIQPLEEQLAAESDAALRKVLELAMSQIGRTLEEEDGW